MWFSELQSAGTKFSFKVKRKLFKIKSKFQKIKIFETVDNGKILVMDNYIMLSERFEYTYHEMISHVPLFTHKNPKDVLIIGGGDGGTARECLKHKYLKNIHLCEIDEAVINASKKHLPFVGESLSNDKISIFIDDAFSFLKKNKYKYDVILIDGLDPSAFLEANRLFSTDFFKILSKSLNEEGVICFLGASPFYELDAIKKLNVNLKKVFKNIYNFVAFVPMYQSGCWSFILVSQSDALLFQEKRWKNFKNKDSLRYFNEAIYRACFALPNEIANTLRK